MLDQGCPISKNYTLQVPHATQTISSELRAPVQCRHPPSCFMHPHRLPPPPPLHWGTRGAVGLHRHDSCLPCPPPPPIHSLDSLSAPCTVLLPTPKGKGKKWKPEEEGEPEDLGCFCSQSGGSSDSLVGCMQLAGYQLDSPVLDYNYSCSSRAQKCFVRDQVLLRLSPTCYSNSFC